MRIEPQVIGTAWEIPSLPSEERWYVVQTQPRAEARAAANLGRQGYRTFCPRRRRTVRHARRATVALVPLFPAYVFLRLDLSRDLWRSVNGTRGVVRLVSNGDVPARVPRGVVESLEARTDAEGAMDWSSSLEAGRPVRILDGAFADLVGTLLELDAGGRVRVLLDLLGRPVSVALPCEILVPAA